MRVEINHPKLFTFGLLYYWVLPILIPVEHPLLSTPDPHRVALYWWNIGGIYLSFLVGDRVGSILRHSQQPARKTIGFSMLLWPSVIALLLFAFFKRDELFFAGYADSAARGTLASISMLIFAIALVRNSAREEFRIRNVYFGMYFLSAALMLLSGGRMYFVLCITALLVYRSSYICKLGIRDVLKVGIPGLALVGVISIVRLDDEGSIGLFFWNMLAESYFASISLLDYLRSHHEPLIAFPSYLLAGLYNLVPTFIAGNKLYMNNPFGVDNPLGALHSYISWMENFGIIGSFLFATSLGFWLRWLRAKNSALSRPIYSLTAAALAFSFWRDDFSISLVKVMLEDAMLFSVVIYYSAALMADVFPNARFALWPLKLRLSPRG